MARKTISLTGELHMNATGFSVTVDALETLKIVGIAYGVYDHAEDLRDCRVTLENGERRHWLFRKMSACMEVPFGKPCVPLQMTRNGSGNMWHFGKR